jgi:NF-kappa-B inhibitor-like protein 2
LYINFYEFTELLQKKKKAEDDGNQQLLAEMCNKLANYYTNEAKYQSALSEFRQEAVIFKAIDKKMDFGRANRMIGEVYMLMGRYKDALKHEDIYLTTAKQENELVEMQRAYATIGRCYLLQSDDESVCGSNDAPADHKAAEKAFLKSLIICNQQVQQNYSTLCNSLFCSFQTWTTRVKMGAC